MRVFIGFLSSLTPQAAGRKPCPRQPQALLATVAGLLGGIGLATLATMLRAGPRTVAPDSPLARLHQAVLSNGLRVYLLPRHDVPVVACDLWYHVGSVDEQKGHTGLAHFLEHMMFKGTNRLGKGQIDAITLARAGENNAETAEDTTHYYFTFPADRWEAALDIEADRMRNTRFDPKEVAAERSVVLEELHRGHDQPFGRLEETLQEISYLSHPYRNPVIGWEPEVARLSRDDLVGFYNRYYQPGNAILVIVGDIDPDRTLAAIRQRFERIPAGPSRPVIGADEPPQKGRRQFHLNQADAALRGMLSWHTVPLDHPDTPALNLLGMILGSGKASRLYQRLIEEKPLATSVSVEHDSRQLAGQLTIALEAVHGVSQETLEAEIAAQVASIVQSGPTEAELQRAKNQWETDRLFGRERANDLARLIGEYATIARWQLADEQFHAALRVGRSDVQRVAARYLTDTNLTAGWSVPDVTSAAAEPAAVAGGPTRDELHGHHSIQPAALQEPLPTTAPELKHWQPSREVLANGLVVLTERRATTPVVTVEVSVDAGQLREEKPGLAYLTGELLDSGTQSRTARQIAETIESVGGSLSTDAHGLTIKVRSADLPLALELASDLLRHATFPEPELAKAKTRIEAEIQADFDEPDTRALLAFDALVYGRHPLGRYSKGMPADVARLSRAAVLAHYARYVVPNNTILAIAGEFDPAVLRAAIQKHWADWPKRPVHFPPIAEPRLGSGPVRKSVPGEHEQAHIIWGHLGIRRTDRDYDALKVLDYVLGTGPGFTDRLSRVLRDERGLAYSVQASITHTASEAPGVFEAVIGTRPEMAQEAIAGILHEVRRVQEGDISPEEVERAKAYLMANWVFGYETSGQVAARLIEAEKYHLGLDYPRTLPAKIRAVTLADVRRVAREHLYPDRGVLVVSGAKTASKK